MGQVGGVSITLLLALLVTAGCTLLMVPAVAIQNAKDDGRTREARAALEELTIGKPPPGGLEAWLSKQRGIAVLQQGDAGSAHLSFPHSVCRVDVELRDMRVTQIDGCLDGCSFAARPVDCSWLKPLVGHE